MSDTYDYQKEKHRLFTDAGQVFFVSVYDIVILLIKQAGACRANEVSKKISGTFDTHLLFAALDRLVELGRLREVTDPAKVWLQHRVFVACEMTA